MATRRETDSVSQTRSGEQAVLDRARGVSARITRQRTEKAGDMVFCSAAMFSKKSMFAEEHRSFLQQFSGGSFFE